MRFSPDTKWTLVAAIGLAMMALPSVAQNGGSLPDVVGIRPGMTPQEAYSALKEHGNGAKVGIGQVILTGVSDKPVALIMSERVLDASPAEVITVWLTAPPARQQVFAVRRTLKFDPQHEMLKSKVVDGLRQKYGPETSTESRRSLGIMDPMIHFWMFNEQGARLDRSGSCLYAGLMNLSEPDNPSTPQPNTPLFVMSPLPNGCTDVVSVSTQLGPGNQGSDFVGVVSVIAQDTSLARRSKEAYAAYLANADEARRKADLEKAKQQKAPAF